MKLKLLNDMMIFVKVVEENSFTGAALELGLSKSAISKYISRLETSLGAQLLHRSTRRLMPTEAGRVLYDSFSRISENLDEAERAVSYTNTEPRGILHIAAPMGFCNLHLVQAVSHFIKLHPDVQVQLSHGLSLDDFMSSSLDLMIHIGELPDSNLVARRLTIRGMRVCASPDYLEKHGTPQEPEELVNHNCLCYKALDMSTYWQFAMPDGPKSVKVRGNFTGRSSQTLEAAAVTGLGIAMLPGYMMTQDLQAGKLIQILADYCPKDIGIYAVYPYTRYVAPKVRVFIDFLVQRFGEESYWDRNA